MMVRSLYLFLVSLTATLFVGCAPTLKVNVLQPARVNLGPSKDLVLVQSEGRRGARDRLVGEFKSAVRERGYFHLKDRMADGITVKLAQDAATLEHPEAIERVAPEAVAVRLDVTGWDVDWASNTVTKKDDKGKEYQEKVEFYEAEVVLAATVLSPLGKTFLAEQEYRATARHPENRDNALTDAADQAIAKFLHDITPHYVTAFIELDDKDEAQSEILDIAREGEILAAISKMESYSQANPTNASALYNLAALNEALGRYQEALALYDRAIALGANQDLHLSTREECAQRLAGQQALAHGDSSL